MPMNTSGSATVSFDAPCGEVADEELPDLLFRSGDQYCNEAREQRHGRDDRPEPIAIPFVMAFVVLPTASRSREDLPGRGVFFFRHEAGVARLRRSLAVRVTVERPFRRCRWRCRRWGPNTSMLIVSPVRVSIPIPHIATPNAMYSKFCVSLHTDTDPRMAAEIIMHRPHGAFEAERQTGNDVRGVSGAARPHDFFTGLYSVPSSIRCTC